MFQFGGMLACLWASAAFAVAAGVCSLLLPEKHTGLLMAEMKTEGAAD